MSRWIFRPVMVIIVFLVSGIMRAYAQCAMCRGSVESSVSSGDTSMAANLNLGILYLFFTPYVVLGALAFLWYMTSKRNAEKVQKASYRTR